MNPVPTLEQVLRDARSGADVLEALRMVPGATIDQEYLHYLEIGDERPPGRHRIWAGLKLRRAGTRVDLSPPLGLSLCFPRRLQDLLLEVMVPLPEQGLSLGVEAAAGLDEAEAGIAEAIALMELDGYVLDPVDSANLLRTGRPARTDVERELVSAYEGLSPDSLDSSDHRKRQGLSKFPGLCEDAGELHPVLGAGVAAVAQMREGWRQALIAWRNALPATGVPGIRRMAVISCLNGSELRHALACMETDEKDATYPLLVLLTALCEARRKLVAGAHARAARLSVIGTYPELNERQVLVVDQINTTPGCATALAYHKRAFNVVYETARTDLQELARRGQLTMTRHGRAFRFTAGAGFLPPAGRPVAARTEPPEPPPAEDSLPVFF